MANDPSLLRELREILPDIKEKKAGGRKVFFSPEREEIKGKNNTEN